MQEEESVGGYEGDGIQTHSQRFISTLGEKRKRQTLHKASEKVPFSVKLFQRTLGLARKPLHFGILRSWIYVCLEINELIDITLMFRAAQGPRLPLKWLNKKKLYLLLAINIMGKHMELH